MQLYERGAFHMSDPITKWLPELKALTVLTEDGERVPVNRPPTMQELLTHTAGFLRIRSSRPCGSSVSESRSLGGERFR